jgi:hypothetical protein
MVCEVPGSEGGGGDEMNVTAGRYQRPRVYQKGIRRQGGDVEGGGRRMGSAARPLLYGRGMMVASGPTPLLVAAVLHSGYCTYSLRPALSLPLEYSMA